uniref:RegX n=1 Tax=Mycobacterium leprae TaxID=1769 RepID=Q50041_MYCLR|nr:regX [Mycobacterium leprae]
MKAIYTARLPGCPLHHLTSKEFELLEYLAQLAGRVFTPAQLLHEVVG